ncbi:MAG: hypothetical protein AB1488_09985 [Nitrospirota bacterium]
MATKNILGVNPVRRLRLLTGRLTRGINPVFAQKGKLFSSLLQAAGHSNGVKSPLDR